MTDDFIFDVMEKFNNSDIVDFEFSRDASKIVLRKKEGCVEKEIYQSVLGNSDYENGLNNLNNHQVNNYKNVKNEDVEIKKNNLNQKNEIKNETEEIKSPIVGTFYRSPSPDSPAYVQKGAKIKKGEPICIIEAMKMMNTFNAEYDFEVVDILVENGDLVEYGQPLFKIKKRNE